MAARYRVGIIACGLIAEAHLRAYRAIPAVEVVAGADLSPEVRARWTNEHGIPRMYATAAEMLERERPDIVSICTWPPLRPEMTELACAHGARGILAEKLAQAGGRAITRSARVQSLLGVPSVAETAALAAAGPTSRLCGPRLAVGRVTCAIATDGEP